MAKDKTKQYIYIVQALLEPSKCKIGKTNDLERRLKEYNNMTGKSKENIYRYLYTCEVKNMTEVENDIKEKYSTLREEKSKEIYFFNSALFKNYVQFIKSHKMFVKEIFIKPDDKKQAVKIVKKTAPSLKERGLSQRDVLQKAQKVNNDEFYTRYEDIEKELSMYNKRIWKNKTVFCNCDDAVDGSIFVHLDNNMVFQIKIIMDEIFGSKNFRGFITRKKCSNKNYTKNTFGNISDYILFYSKTDAYKWHRPAEIWTDEKIDKEYPYIDEATGRKYKKVPIHAPGVRNGETGKLWKGMLPPPGKHWQYTPDKLTELDSSGQIYWSANGNPRRKVFLDEDKGVPVQDIWLNLQDSLNQNIKITGYPTEKNPYLLERIINASSDKGGIVLDCFAGSGTTLDAANQLGRNYIGIDNSFEAISNIIKRFSVGLEEMGDYVNENSEFDAVPQGLFVFSSETEYNTDNASSMNFSFFSDNRYGNISKNLFDKYLSDITKNGINKMNIELPLI